MELPLRRSVHLDFAMQHVPVDGRKKYLEFPGKAAQRNIAEMCDATDAASGCKSWQKKNAP